MEFRRRQLSHPRVADIPVIVVSAVHARREGGTVSWAAHPSTPIDFDACFAPSRRSVEWRPMRDTRRGDEAFPFSGNP
jgi:hypothetical protein